MAKRRVPIAAAYAGQAVNAELAKSTSEILN
jgi:hypothetical protein